jgi:Zn-dependent protease with chaperone function
MDPLGTVAVVTLVWAGAAVSTAALVSAVWRWVEARTARLHPSDAAWVSSGIAIAPFVVPTLIVMLCLAPGTLGLLGLPVDHCLSHPDHPHLCLAHASIGLTPLLVVWLVGVGVAASLCGVRVVRRLIEARHGFSFLELARVSTSTSDVGVIESPHPFSITAGLVRPRIWLSTGLVAALTEEQLAVVEAHERAHLGRRDPLLRMLAGWLSLPILPSARRSILERLHLASEQACDEAAGIVVGDRVLVAETLLAVARLIGPKPTASPPPVAASFGRGFVAARVGSLLDPIGVEPRRRLTRWLPGTLLVGSLLVVPLHHTVEHILEAVGIGY